MTLTMLVALRQTAEGRTRRRVTLRLPAAKAIIGLTGRQVAVLPLVCAKASSRQRPLREGPLRRPKP